MLAVHKKSIVLAWLGQLFFCSFNACKYNVACKALFDRLVAKGKSKKLALIAVCNKLLKQAFSIVKNRLPYDVNFRSVLVENYSVFTCFLPQFFVGGSFCFPVESSFRYLHKTLSEAIYFP